jgi:hypothetical protein
MQEKQNNETTYPCVTIGSRTERWGRVATAASGLQVFGLGIARAGDVVIYGDGSDAVTIVKSPGVTHGGEAA